MIILSKQAGGTGVRLGIFLWLIEAAKVDQIFTRLAVTPDRLRLMDELFTCLLPVGQTKKKLPFFKITHEKNGQSNSSFHFFKQCKLRGTLFDFFFFSSPFVTSTGNDLGNGIEIAADRRFYFGLHSETEGGGLLFRFVVNINIFTSHPATRGGGDEIKFPRIVRARGKKIQQMKSAAWLFAFSAAYWIPIKSNGFWCRFTRLWDVGVNFFGFGPFQGSMLMARMFLKKWPIYWNLNDPRNVHTSRVYT